MSVSGFSTLAFSWEISPSPCISHCKRGRTEVIILLFYSYLLYPYLLYIMSFIIFIILFFLV